jgi:hypothetical protein
LAGCGRSEAVLKPLSWHDTALLNGSKCTLPKDKTVKALQCNNTYLADSIIGSELLSRDDIVRANNGGFVGLAIDY